jgi:hypothetical protein
MTGLVERVHSERHGARVTRQVRVAQIDAEAPQITATA